MMIWKSVFASAEGTAHAQSHQACQDACDVQVDSSYWIGVVCDGAGSASRGGEGARFFVKHVTSHIRSITPAEMTLEQIAQCVNRSRQALCEYAHQEQGRPRDYACTLLLAVIGPQQAWFAQIGDGAMVVSSGFVQGVVFWPEQGSYANMTHFVTDEIALDHLRLCEVNTSIKEIAILSDGLQRLALNYAQQTPHYEFFAPMWLQLRRQLQGELQQPLEDFLRSDPVNNRTDDDKTLVLASCLSVSPV